VLMHLGLCLILLKDLVKFKREGFHFHFESSPFRFNIIDWILVRIWLLCLFIFRLLMIAFILERFLLFLLCHLCFLFLDFKAKSLSNMRAVDECVESL
jgi:hypothetical protein